MSRQKIGSNVTPGERIGISHLRACKSMPSNSEIESVVLPTSFGVWGKPAVVADSQHSVPVVPKSIRVARVRRRRTGKGTPPGERNGVEVTSPGNDVCEIAVNGAMAGVYFSGVIWCVEAVPAGSGECSDGAATTRADVGCAVERRRFVAFGPRSVV